MKSRRTTKIVYSSGNTYSFIEVENRGKVYHNDDGPAVICPGNGSEWYRYGIRHRDDGPAVEYEDGTKYWYINGNRHREDGPAIEWHDGDCDYFRKGKRHRLDGPAVIRTLPLSLGGRRYLYVNGKHLSNNDSYQKAVAHWLSYKEVTREDITDQIGNFRIVEWD